MAEILKIDVDDGIVFDAGEITATEIREDQVYGGKRLKTTAYLGKTKIPITVDIGFGDALGDPNFEIEYGSLLDFDPVTIRAYSPETVIAEKFQAVVSLGLANGRMKDFYDLWAIPKAKEISDDQLALTIRSTFDRRRTNIPTEQPPGLSNEFAADATKIAQWTAYAESTELEGVSLKTVVEEIWQRLAPICAAASRLSSPSRG